MTIKIEKRALTVEEYQALRASTNWSQLSETVVAKALQNDLFSVCALEGTKAVGIGRVVGDAAIYYYIQDVIVLPAYQKKGIGKLIMGAIEEYLSQQTAKNAFIGLMAAQGVADFYKKYGYEPRADGAPGMFKTVK